MMRMARVNVYLPDELHQRAKRARLSVSELCQRAVQEELLRRERLRALERFNEELVERQGPAEPAEIARAEAWVDEVLGAAGRAHAPAARRKPPIGRSKRTA
jgi:post-segregation antitoxin (ccd killing protein)